MSASEGTQRVAIVTGGGTALGRGTVEVLSADGVDCVIAGRREAPLLETQEALAGSPGAVHVVVGDVTSEVGRAAILDGAIERFGRLDILVNNAGGGGNNAPLLEYTVAAWREVLEVNLEASFFMAQGAVSHMRAGGWGRIVNIASIYGSLGGDNIAFEQAGSAEEGPRRAPSYNAAKAGVINLSRDLAVALAPWNITVNAVSPGFIERPERPRDPAFRERLASRTPAGRLGEPRDVGYAVGFLVSERAGFITGTELVVDGGWSAW